MRHKLVLWFPRKLLLCVVIAFAMLVPQGCKRWMGADARRSYAAPAQVDMASAIESENTKEIVRLLESGKVKPNDAADPVPNERAPQYNFLTFAVEFNKQHAIHTLIEHGADPNAKSPRDGYSPMATAAASADSSLLPLLVSFCGDINLHGRTKEPLTFDAFMASRFSNLQYLLDHDVNLNAQDTTGETLLGLLANVNAYDWMLTVLALGADPKVDRRGNTYLVGWTVQERQAALHLKLRDCASK